MVIMILVLSIKVLTSTMHLPINLSHIDQVELSHSSPTTRTSLLGQGIWVPTPYQLDSANQAITKIQLKNSSRTESPVDSV